MVAFSTKEAEPELNPRSRDDRKMTTWNEKTVTRGATVAATKRMCKFLKHFAVVGDDYQAWNLNYKNWENEEEEEEEQLPQAPTWGEEGRAADTNMASASQPKRPLDFRATLRMLFSSHRFQVIIICLVVLDAVLVLAGLIPDLKILQPSENHYAARGLHYLSIATLTFFMLEIAF